MRSQSGLLVPLALGALVLALASCGDQPTQPNLPAARPPITAASAPAPDTWIPRAPEPVNRRGFVTASFTNYIGEQNVYVIGGYDPYTGKSLKLVEAYNVATDTWSRKSDLLFEVSTPNGAGVIHGGVFIAGGHRDTNLGWTTYGMWRYNLGADAWSTGRGMPVKGADGVVGVIGDKLYVAEPSEKQADRSNFLRYDPATYTWATLPSPAHAYHMGGVLYGKLYLVGNQTEAYDPATNQWTAKASPPSQYINVAGSAASAKAKLYVFGGSRVLVYAPLTDTWTVRKQGPLSSGLVATRIFVDGRPRIELVGESSNYQYIP